MAGRNPHFSPGRWVDQEVTVRSGRGLDLLRVCPLCRPSNRRSVPLPPPSGLGAESGDETRGVGTIWSVRQPCRGVSRLASTLGWPVRGVVQPLRWWLSGDTDAMWLDRCREDADRPFFHGLTEQLRWTGQPSINPESEPVKWSGKLPVLRIGDIGLCASSRLASLGLLAVCGPLFFAVGFLADSTVFPQGSLWRERPPLRGVRWPKACPPYPPLSCRTSGPKRVAPSTSTPLVRRAGAPGEAGTREAQPRIAFSQRMRKMPVVPRPMRRFGKVPNHNGMGATL